MFWKEILVSCNFTPSLRLDVNNYLANPCKRGYYTCTIAIHQFFCSGEYRSLPKRHHHLQNDEKSCKKNQDVNFKYY